MSSSGASLYLGLDKLYEVNLNTGAATAVANFGNGAAHWYGGLTFAGSTMYAGTMTLGENRLDTIHPVTGAVTVGPNVTGAGYSTGYWGDFFGMTAVNPVPEPGTLTAGIGAGLLALGALVRRARR